MKPSPSTLIAAGIALGALSGGIADAETPGIDGARIATAIARIVGDQLGEKVVAALGIIGWVMAGIGWLQLRTSDSKGTP